jgi:uncharacterized protein YfaS (alpha-2-macroglobulin family)
VAAVSAVLFGGFALAKKATTDDLGGADRCLTHISTDKPIYRTGERVYVRGVVLNARTHAPLKDNAQVQALVEIKGPKGDTVASGRAASQDSVVGFQWDVPADQAGGEYTIRMSYPWHGYAPAERKFDIRAYRPPRLKSQVVFLRDGYGPGDEVTATLHTERAEGGIPDGASVTAIARVDGSDVHTGKAAVDARGNCTVSFKLPDKIERGEGTLALVIEDGGVVETAAKTIPILLQTVDLRLFPEGGDLVAGLPCRVYFEAKTPAKKPADIAGVILDTKGKEVAQFRSEHEGRGRFDLTPEKGGKYTLKITEPTGILTTFPLPDVKDFGATIYALDDLTPKGEKVRLKVTSTVGGKLKVTLSKREAEVSSAPWRAEPKVASRLYLDPPADADGVLVATVWDEEGKPLAERLVYRQPQKSLRISIAADKRVYVPGDAARLTVKATDEDGKPVSAVVGVTVTDDSVLEMIEKREQAPRLPVMVLLEDEVEELADAHVYLDAGNPKAPVAMDLLLGTQGWRRFAFLDAGKFIEQSADKALRVLALRVPPPPPDAVVDGGGPGGGKGGGVWRWLGIARHERAARGAVAPQGAELAEVEDAGVEAPRPAAKPQAVAAEPPALEKLAKVAAKAEAKRMKEQMVVVDEPKEGDMEVRLRADFVAVRVYAHPVRPDRRPGDRVDFTETLYWHAGVRTDAKGEAEVSFALNDSVTTFRVFADAYSEGGALGQESGAVESVEPFYIEPKLPLEVTSGDIIRLPVSVVNGVGSDLGDASVTVTAARGMEIASVAPFTLKANARERRILDISVGKYIGLSDFVLSAKAGPYADKVTRKLPVKSLGFPTEVGSGGTLALNSGVSKAVTIPASVVRGSVATNIAVYPTPLANLTQALERLIQEPNGCFEQTSSTAYPLVMAQQYFMSHHGVEPSLVQRSREMLDRGYKRLVGFECKERGYEWFGGDPGHEALTAYGLLEFTDMAQVRDVDAEMSKRTRDWLLKRRDDKGGFLRNQRALDSFGQAPEPTTNAYCVWALLEAGQTGLDKEVAAVKAEAERSKDAYVIALAANILQLSKDAAAKDLTDRLTKMQTKDGSVEGAVTSITRSGGEALTIETTSLALLAWMRDPACAGAAEKGIRYLYESCKSGRFGSTQSTVLALRAIVAYDKARARPTAKGSVQLYVDGRNVGAPMPFDKETQGAIKFPDIGEVFEPGEHKVELRMSDGSDMPYSIAINYHSETPVSAKECQIGLKVALSDSKVAEGAVTEANVSVTNLAKEHSPMTVAIVGVPGGLEPRHDQLKELVKSRKIDAYEVIGREVVLYWRSLKPEQKADVAISLVAAVPGTYTGPASRAYLYYTDEFKCWTDGMKVTIAPRAE